MSNPRNTHDREAVEALRAAVPAGTHFFEPINRSTGFDKSAAEGVATLAFNPDAPGVQNYYHVANYIITYAAPRKTTPLATKKGPSAARPPRDPGQEALEASHVLVEALKHIAATTRSTDTELLRNLCHVHEEITSLLQTLIAQAGQGRKAPFV